MDPNDNPPTPVNYAELLGALFAEFERIAADVTKKSSDLADQTLRLRNELDELGILYTTLSEERDELRKRLSKLDSRCAELQIATAHLTDANLMLSTELQTTQEQAVYFLRESEFWRTQKANLWTWATNEMERLVAENDVLVQEKAEMWLSSQNEIIALRYDIRHPLRHLFRKIKRLFVRSATDHSPENGE